MWPWHKDTCARVAWARKCEQNAKENHDALAGLTPDEIKWKAFLGGHGHGIHITEETLADFDPSVKANSIVNDAPAKLLGARSDEVKPETVDGDLNKPRPISFGMAELAPLPERLGTDAFLADITLLCVNVWDKDPIREGHGMKYPRYTWRQTTKDVEIRVLLPTGTTGKQLDVSVQPTHIKVVLGEHVLIDHELEGQAYIGSPSDDNGSFWEIERRQVLYIYLSKWIKQ